MHITEVDIAFLEAAMLALNKKREVEYRHRIRKGILCYYVEYQPTIMVVEEDYKYWHRYRGAWFFTRKGAELWLARKFLKDD